MKVFHLTCQERLSAHIITQRLLKGFESFLFSPCRGESNHSSVPPTFFLLRIRQILSSDCKRVYFWLISDLTFSFLSPYSIVLNFPLPIPLFHPSPLLLSHKSLYLCPLDSVPSLTPFLIPIHSILVVLIFILRNSASLRLFWNYCSSSSLDYPFSDFLFFSMEFF